jgi:stage III sporulation protein AC
MDITTIFQIAGIGIVLGMVHTVLKMTGKEDFANWITLFGFVFVLIKVASVLDELFQKIQSVFLFHG